nr:MAG TPA: hypothetical protein [Caudoviricetes sp.]
MTDVGYNPEVLPTIAGNSFPINEDIINVIFFTSILLIVDIVLKITIETVAYLRTVGKRITVWNCITTFCWYGWQYVPIGNGRYHRFLISKHFRWGLFSKVILQYPLIFFIGYCCFLLPNIKVMGFEFDNFMGFLFTLIPPICELTSIIEKLNELNADVVRKGEDIISFIRRMGG